MNHGSRLMRGLGALLLSSAFFSAGCSMEPGAKSSRIRVNLVPNGTETSPFALLSGPNAISDLNCVGLNVHHGNIVTGSACGGAIESGIWAGALASRTGSFEVDLPTGTSTVFEAFGFQGSNCPAMTAALSAGIPGDALFTGKLYRLGKTVVDIKDQTAAISISTTFDANQGYQCAVPSNDFFLFGDANVEGSTDSHSVGLADASVFTPAKSGVVRKLSAYISAGSDITELLIGLYDDSGGHPGNLLTQGVVSTTVIAGFNTASVSPVSVNGGQNYWIAILATTGHGTTFIFPYGSGGSQITEHSSSAALTSLPATWTPGSTFGSTFCSFFASGY